MWKIIMENVREVVDNIEFTTWSSFDSFAVFSPSFKIDLDG